MTPDSGRVAIVTGAGPGLGRAMALGLAHAGIRVVATAARERTELEKVGAEAAEGMVLQLLAESPRKGTRSASCRRPWRNSAGWIPWSTTPAEA